MIDLLILIHVRSDHMNLISISNDIILAFSSSVLCLFSFFSYSLQDACTNIDCGKGTCVVDEVIILGFLFHCKCNDGWSTIKAGPMSFGSCVVPNCSLDFSCDGKYPPTPPFTLINFTSPYFNFVWCGDGVCTLNATKTGHYCQCHERAANLFNNLENICIQQCYLDGDCGQLGLLPPLPPPSSVAAPRGGKSFYKLLTVLMRLSFMYALELVWSQI